MVVPPGQVVYVTRLLTADELRRTDNLGVEVVFWDKSHDRLNGCVF